MINSRFTVAVHLLSLLALGGERFPGVPLTSEVASESVNTNPVVVRRILGALRKSGIVSSQPGPTGGWLLEREPNQISLRDVYRAVQDETLFSMHHRPPSGRCVIGANIQQTLQGIFAGAEAAMEEKLGEQTVADVVDAVMARVGTRAG
jgi:Rrf2 family protein